jgi:hypothetical protein
MKICGLAFTEKTIGDVQRAVDSNPAISRRSLSRSLCELHDWRSVSGRLKEVVCRKAVSILHSRHLVRLPEASPVAAFQIRPAHKPYQRPAVNCTLAELGDVNLLLIDNPRSKYANIWKSLMAGHYLGERTFYAGLRYLIHSSEHGYLGALAFSSAAFRLASRDNLIGWDDKTRSKNLHQIIGNSRFYIHPSVNVPHLASHIIGKTMRRVGYDWKNRYKITPLLVETFVDTNRFKGTSYRAANWIYAGVTTGRGRQNKEPDAKLTPRDIYLYPLHRNWRELLGGTVKVPVAPTGDWALQEWGSAPLGDARLVQRLVTLGRDRYARPQASIPQTCCSRAKTKAAYRFFDHEETTLENLMTPHIEATRGRIAKEKIVLAIQDTSTLNYSTHPATENLGSIGSIDPDKIIGLVLHATIAVNTEGTPLGVIDAQSWARNPEEFGKKKERKSLPIEQKESYKWLKSFHVATATAKACHDTTVVSVGDREADLFELFALADKTPNAPYLLVRAVHDRKLAEEQGQLLEHMSRCPVVGVQELLVPRRGSRPARTVQLSIRYSKVTLAVPKRVKSESPLSIWVVTAEEEQAPEGVECLKWVLLTTAPVNSFEDAAERLSWYRQRWTIEVFFRTLKSGCQIENRQLGSANRLEACLAIDLVVAWRIHHLTKLGRETPDVPCSVYFEEAEWRALVTFVTKNPTPAAKPPTLKEAIQMVAVLGGFLGRKGDGDPGTQVLWLGLQRLDDITEMWKVMSAILGQPPPASHISGAKRKCG